MQEDIPVRRRIPIPILFRRIVSLFLGVLFFLAVAPLLGSAAELFFYLIVFLGPAVCVFLFAGRNSIVEGVGWSLLLFDGIMFLVSA